MTNSEHSERETDMKHDLPRQQATINAKPSRQDLSRRVASLDWWAERMGL